MTHEEPSPADEAPLSKNQRLFMAAFALAFVVLALAPNLGAGPKLFAPLRLSHKWDMFVRPPSGDIAMAVGVPRTGGANDAPLVLVDPSRRDPSFFARLRDARQRKLFEYVGKVPELSKLQAGPLQQSYLAYLCRTHGARVSEVQIVVLPRDGKAPRKLVSLSCESPS